MPYRDIPDVNFKLLEFCKYQHSLIKRYEEYIEKNIHAKILKEDCARKFPPAPDDMCVAKRIVIPQTELVVFCDPHVFSNWEQLKFENPLISPDYFMHIAYQELMEKKNAKAD